MKTCVRATLGFRGPVLGSLLLPTVLSLALLAAHAARAATRTWGGGGANNNWSTAANWDAAISPGDQLVFPGSAPADSLNNTNDFTADTTFGSITLSGTNYLLRGNSIVLSNGIVAPSGGTNTVTFPIRLSANQQFSNQVAGALVIDGTTLNLNNHDLTIFAGGRIEISASIAGIGNLIKASTGTLRLLGSSANTYVGTAQVNTGLLELNKTPGANAITGALMIGDGLGGANADIVRLQGNAQIADTSAVTITGSGQLDVNGFIEIVGPLSGSGNLQLVNGTFSVGFNSSTVTFDGTISGTQNMVRNGSGIWILNGTNTYSGFFTINGPTLVNGVLPGNGITVYGTLGGTGTVGRVTIGAGGTLSPGLSAGKLTTGNLSFAGGSTLRVELNGTTPGAGYDQLKVNGSVTLGGAALNATLGFPSALGNSFMIIDNDGSEAVTNTFLGLAEGGTLNISGTSFSISYVGGTGNDVVLTQTAATQYPVLTIQRVAPANVVLSWPTNFNGFTLEANTNLTSSLWSVVSPAPAIGGTNNVVTNAVVETRKFYRLRAP